VIAWPSVHARLTLWLTANSPARAIMASSTTRQASDRDARLQKSVARLDNDDPLFGRPSRVWPNGWGIGGVWAGLTAFIVVRLVGMVLRTRGGRWLVLGEQR